MACRHPRAQCSHGVQSAEIGENQLYLDACATSARVCVEYDRFQAGKSRASHFFDGLRIFKQLPFVHGLGEHAIFLLLREYSIPFTVTSFHIDWFRNLESKQRRSYS